MKLVKMSLAAAVLLGASAFAIDNVKVSGNAKLYYSTSNNDDDATNNSADLFEKDTNSAGQVSVKIGATADLTKNVSGGATVYALSTLGLENNLVGNVWEAGTQDQYWFGEAWLAATLGKTTLKAGRMELDTPFAFSEQWSVVPNTFEGAVAINQDIPDTTLVGAWVGKSNGSSDGQGTGVGGVITTTGNAANNNSFTTFMDDVNVNDDDNNGAYAFGVVNNSFKPLTAQGWYYDVLNVANAYWLQADIDCQLVKGMKIGAQYANMDPDAAGAKDSTGYALKVGYEGVQNLKVSAAFSNVDDEGVLKVANIGTNNTTGQSKLYTEAWWNYGYVGAIGATSYTLAAEYNAGIAKFAAQYTDVTVDPKGSNNTVDMNEFALTATKSFGPLDATLAYISTDADDKNDNDGSADRFDTIQAYLTLNF